MALKGTQTAAPANAYDRINSVSIRQVAELLGISRDSVRRRIRDGSLPAYTIGGRMVRIRVADVEALIQRGAK